MTEVVLLLHVDDESGESVGSEMDIEGLLDDDNDTDNVTWGRVHVQERLGNGSDNVRAVTVRVCDTRTPPPSPWDS